jgi:hypothetical protein
MFENGKDYTGNQCPAHNTYVAVMVKKKEMAFRELKLKHDMETNIMMLTGVITLGTQINCKR